MTAAATTVRALFQIDRLQPKFAAYNGATVQGSIPLAGDTILVGELAPGNDVFRLIDIALKAATIEATSQIVEREFGFFILRSPVNSEIVAARGCDPFPLGYVDGRSAQADCGVDTNHHFGRALSSPASQQVAQRINVGAGPNAWHHRVCSCRLRSDRSQRSGKGSIDRHRRSAGRGKVWPIFHVRIGGRSADRDGCRSGCDWDH